MFKTRFILISIFSFCFLKGCQSWTVGSKESMDARERQPWRPDESSVAGLENRSPKRVTPHVGFNMPIDEPSKIILKSREIPDSESLDSFKTRLDKKRRSIIIVPEKSN
ncbi:MAG: hypothetical protein ACRYGR_07255 [Janthinobacterium lividum]